MEVALGAEDEVAQDGTVRLLIAELREHLASIISRLSGDESGQDVQELLPLGSSRLVERPEIEELTGPLALLTRGGLRGEAHLGLARGHVVHDERARILAHGIDDLVGVLRWLQSPQAGRKFFQAKAPAALRLLAWA